MQLKKQYLKLIFFMILVICIWLTILKSGLSFSDLSPQLILEITHNNIFLVLLLMLLLMTLQNLFTFIPLILVITINISLFGFWRGYLFSSFSSVIGSTSIFFSVRYFFADLFSSGKYNKYERKIEKNGFLFVLFGRILPFLPTNLINIVSGISKMKVSHFVSATAIGNMIYGLVLASISFGALSLSSQHKQLFYGILIIIVIFIIWRYTKKLSSSRT